MKKKILGLALLSSFALASCDAVIGTTTSDVTSDTSETSSETTTSETSESTSSESSSETTTSTEVIEELSAGSYEEGLYAVWEGTSVENVVVEYASTTDYEYKTVDSELVRVLSNGTVRADIVGLSAGSYIIKVTKSDYTKAISEIQTVTNYDRSGYAHFDCESDGTGVDVSEGIGAYDNNGELKEDTNVLYVTDDTKNTVTLTIEGKEYTGLLSILNAQQYSSVPLDVRIIGSIETTQWNAKEATNDSEGKAYFEGSDGTIYQETLTADQIIEYGINSYSDDLAKGITALDGLSSKASYKNGEYDSAWNNGLVKLANNTTVEGIGTDATIFQWGFTFKQCSSLEVRNLTFDDYTEDACGIEGSVSSSTISNFAEGHIWIHNNTFEQGNNRWDVTMEQDKAEGDGATDMKKLAFITLSYNHYHENHKTGLVGGGNTQLTSCVTFHHNWYEDCSSRLPLAREANMHMYNNYYDGTTGTNMSLRANAYAFIEGCYFEDTKNPVSIDTNTGSGTADDKDSDGNKISFTFSAGAAKIYGCVFDNVSGSLGGTLVSSRTATVENTNLYGQTFDTDSSIFYYDEENQVSDVTYLTSAAQAKIDCQEMSGVHR